MNESSAVSIDIKPAKEKEKWSVAERVKLVLLITGLIAFVFGFIVSVFVPKSLIADILGGKSQAEYSFQGTVQVAIKEKIVADYNPVTGEASGNHTVYTYTDCLWFKPDDNLFSPNYMLIPDYFLEKDRDSAMNALKEIVEKGEKFEVYRYDKTVSHIVYYNVNGYRMKCVLPIHKDNNEYVIKESDNEERYLISISGN